jgi:uncharacterized protein YgiM (DUF1202 family)
MSYDPKRRVYHSDGGPRLPGSPKRFDINELPVWTWVGILLVVVVIGGALWLMTRSANQPATSGAPTVAAGTPTPIIAGNSPTPPPPSQVAVGVKVQVEGTGADKLRVRTGPGTDYATAIIVPDGTPAKVLEGPQSNAGVIWWRIQLDDGTVGWAAGDYLKPIGW